MMRRVAATAAWTCIVIVGIVAAGCSRQPGTSAIASMTPPSATPAAASLALDSPIASLAAVPSAGPSASPVDPGVPEPPAASVAVEGGDPVVGELGSFTWDNSGSDAPWVPGNPVHVGRGELLTMALASPVRIEHWTVARTPGATFGSDAVRIGEGTAEPVAFVAPPPGSWSVSVNVWFADNRGSASYYWLITVG
jgi:hypothetical protein